MVAQDTTIKYRDRFVMVPVSKDTKRCREKEPQLMFQCQLQADHKGEDHLFWKDIPLLRWPNE